MANTATLNITLVYTTDPVVSIKDRAIRRADKPHMALEFLINELRRMQAGNSVGKVMAYLDAGDGTAGIGRLACASVADGDTATVGEVTFTAKTTVSSDANTALNQFTRGGTDTADAASLAAAINAHPLLKGLCTAAGSSGNCNITMSDKGLHGNWLVLASTGGTITVTQVTALTPGAHGTTSAHIRCFRRG